jgi:hypothetical protein
VAGGGDYILTVKNNQEHLREDIEACFIHAYDNDFHGVRYETYEIGKIKCVCPALKPVSPVA